MQIDEHANRCTSSLLGIMSVVRIHYESLII